MAKKRQGDLTEKAARMAASDVVQPEQQLDAAIAETLGPAVMAAGHGEMLLADEIMGPDSDAPLSAADTILAEAAVSAPGEVSGEGEKPVLADAGGPPAESPPAPEPASSADSQPAAASDEQGESPAVEGASAEDPPGEVPEEELNPLESLGVISAEELADAVNEAEAATEASAEPVTVTDEGIAAAPAADPGAQAVPPAAQGQAPDAALHQNPLTAPGLTEKLAENIARIETLSQRLLRAVAGKPMRAASIEALSASRLVRPAIEPISSTITPIWSADWASVLIVASALPAASLASRASSAECAACRLISPIDMANSSLAAAAAATPVEASPIARETWSIWLAD